MKPDAAPISGRFRSTPELENSTATKGRAALRQVVGRQARWTVNQRPLSLVAQLHCNVLMAARTSNNWRDCDFSL